MGRLDGWVHRGITRGDSEPMSEKSCILQLITVGKDRPKHMTCGHDFPNFMTWWISFPDNTEIGDKAHIFQNIFQSQSC